MGPIQPPNAPRPEEFAHYYATVNGIRLHYVMEGTGPRTVVLCHGWPDRGFGLTDAPADLATYGSRTLTTDLAELLNHLQVPKAVFIGHDWGGNVAWRMCLFHPTRVAAVAGICTPYTPPHRQFIPLEEVVERLPQLSYQLFLASPAAAPEIESNVRYERVGVEAASVAFSPLWVGPKLTNLPELLFRAVHRSSEEGDALEFTDQSISATSFLSNFGDPPRSPMISAEEIDYYARMYKQRGAQGGLNWYRNRKICWEEERTLSRQVDHLALMVTVGKDPALPPFMADKMERDVKNLTRAHIEDAAHWVQVERRLELNRILIGWLQSLPAAAFAPDGYDRSGGAQARL